MDQQIHMHTGEKQEITNVDYMSYKHVCHGNYKKCFQLRASLMEI